MKKHLPNRLSNPPICWRDVSSIAWALLFFFTGSLAQATSAHDVPGPSSRKTPIAISEIMWKPAPRTDGKNLEYVEIYNSNPWFQDISGYQISCADMNYAFPAGTTIASNSFI